ncbi:type VII secretion integral membrane protein EccD [Nakamurella alba]|uniref:type VII secretion integral membrane protein EccD n=1 Tax=Nakamurella alba TaxID=2665158 RepID=UPI0018A90BC7|nr:type VII secretion integral membrane protein EccD [Nakamurella alba]
MGTRFTRVTVVGEHAQLDVSLPADAPLGGQMPTVLRLLSVPAAATPVRWRLVTPAIGALSPERSLDELGVLDGTVLHLTEADAAPPPPFVDDVERAVAEIVGEQTPPWSGTARRTAVGWLLLPVLLATVLLGAASTGTVGWLAPAVGAVAALLAGALLPGSGGLAAVLISPLAAVGVVYGIAAGRPGFGEGTAVPASLITPSLNWDGFPLVPLLAAAVGGLLAAVARRSLGAMVAGAVIVVAGSLALLCERFGMPAERTAALGLVLAVLISGVAGQLALGGAGLVDLIVADERGVRLPRARVAEAVARGTSLATGAVAGATVTGGLSVLLLMGGTAAAGWFSPALGALGGLVFALRSRMFSRAAHVAPMIAVPVAAAVGACLALPGWLPESGGVAVLGGLVLVGVVVAAAGLGRLTDVAGARASRVLDRVELLAVLALVPGVVLIFGVISLVQRWVG